MDTSNLRPLSANELLAKAHDFTFDNSIRLKYWLRTAQALLQEAAIYEREGNIQQAFFLLARYAILITDFFPQHPDRKLPELKQALRPIYKSYDEVFRQLEQIKPAIERRYQKWQTISESSRRNESSTRERVSNRFEHSDPAIAGRPKTLAAYENEDLAVRLAQKEIQRRDTRRRATQQAGINPNVVQERRGAGLWNDSSWEIAHPEFNNSKNDLPAMMQSARRTLDSRDVDADSTSRSSSAYTDANSHVSSYQYPSVQLSQNPQYQTSESIPPSLQINRPAPPPPRPVKETLSLGTQAPLRPAKDPMITAHPVTEPPSSADAASIDESTQYTFKPSAYLENGSPLRTLMLPQKLRARFLEIARPNTNKNIETCGMLCGTLISNALFVSRLVIPEQTGTSDTCETINEGALFDFVDSEDLMVLGWIHTHPSQTCFMSSRDLHTHAGYQVMMPEAVAIVCAPQKTPDWGVFRLTDPPGMRTVLNCKQTGLFHPHGEADIYTNALRPGHVFEARGMEFGVVDLRPR